MKTALTIALGLVSAVMLIEGIGLYIHTLGNVQGSDFGMLITLTHQLSLFMLWAGLFTLWRMVSESEKLAGKPNN